ncbi:substrate-binding domain-containing protein [Mediterraneibacter massiliensis]|uniref:substrate-binding domain-containing protein n=1 Tax=Mediterraneibacter massiliensis TaxID=1720300 RepID=UPI0024AD875A|nr:substrate-binding domain-containing protein [Mediterraneibacter massiliensis]
MNKMKKSMAVLLTGAMVCGLAACGNQDKKEEKTADGKEKLTIGYTFPSTNNEFWGINSLDCAKQAADALGFELLADDCNYDQAEQVSDVESMISSGIDALVLAPQDASVCAGITAACKEADIPVVIIDRWCGDDLKAGEDYICFIGPNDEQAGYDIAMSLIDAGCKQIVGVGGVQGTSVGEDRKKGLDKALEENPDVELLQFEYAGDTWDDGDAAFRNLYQAHPDMDGVWCFNDSLALASVNVLKEEGKLADVKVGGMDLLSPSIESMKGKELWFSTGGHYMQAGFAAVIAYDAANGVKYDGEEKIQLNLLSVDQTKVADFEEQYVNTDETFDWASVSKAKNPDAEYNFELTLK